MADYFALMARDRKAGQAYAAALGPSGRLKYPQIPTINIGSVSKPVLVPAELVSVPFGQFCSGAMTGDMTASVIR